MTAEQDRLEATIDRLTTRQIPLAEQLRLVDLDGISYQRAVNLLRQYGLTLKQYSKLLDDQNGRCKICQTGIRGTYITKSENVRLRAHVDHDHSSGLVRGLLCGSCNAGLGFFKDSIRNLACAIVYLEDNGKVFQ